MDSPDALPHFPASWPDTALSRSGTTTLHGQETALHTPIIRAIPLLNVIIIFLFSWSSVPSHTTTFDEPLSDARDSARARIEPSESASPASDTHERDVARNAFPGSWDEE